MIGGNVTQTSFFRDSAFEELSASYLSNSKPFPHGYVDDFLTQDVLTEVIAEFPSANEKLWSRYDNPLEKKSLSNHWDFFPPTTYALMAMLNSTEMSSRLAESLQIGKALYPDPGLNGGGWHLHKTGEKLNVHQDYSLHPKLGLQRKLNLIIYVSPRWLKEWGGGLGLWEGTSTSPERLVKTIDCMANRAVIFDTTMNSWHGLPDPLTCPKSEFRMSIASYYLVEPDVDVLTRGKALFAPSEEQKGDVEIEKLIEMRASTNTAKQVYES
jgi:Rps23 Pro-64 3,4-dihydroxylase Tpa1-like proline 4-hydroxylase